MISAIVWIFVASPILGWIKYSTIDKGNDKWLWQRKFAEIWNCSVNFLIAGLAAYYFILMRWPKIGLGQEVGINDFIILIIFMMGLFGHLNVLSFNITEGIQAIFAKVLDK